MTDQREGTAAVEEEEAGPEEETEEAEAATATVETGEAMESAEEVREDPTKTDAARVDRDNHNTLQKMLIHLKWRRLLKISNRKTNVRIKIFIKYSIK